MKRVIITAFKILNNKYEVEVVERIGFESFPIYKNSLNSNSLSNLSNFIAKSKETIEKIIEGQLKDVLLFVENNQSFKIKNKFISSNKCLDASDYQLNQALINEHKKNNEYLIDCDYILKAKNKNYYSINSMDLNKAKSIFEVMKLNHLNIAKIYVIDNLKNHSLLLKNNSRLAIVSSFKNDKTILNLVNNSTNMISEVLEIGLDDLVKKISQKKQISIADANALLISLNEQNDFESDFDVYQILNEYAHKLITKIVKLSEINNFSDKLDLIFDSNFSILNNFINLINWKLIAKSFKINMPNHFISEEMQGVIKLLENIEIIDQNITLTIELFTIRTFDNIESRPSYLFS